ncbi:MAG: FAD-binding oxidoreductase [Burkholderiaceae bacterium]
MISGEVRQLRHSDYPMSAAERQQGHILMCTNTAVSDLVVEGLVARGPADIPEQEIVARVKDIGNLGSDTLQLHLQTPRSARLRFLAGQFVTLGVAVGDDDAVATYPVASCPCDERNLLFHVARDPADPFASRLFEGGLEAGDGVNVRGPIGDFVLDADSERSPVFLACDTGFAPIRGLIEHAISIDDSQSMSLYWLGTRTDGHYLDNQCRAWAAALDEFNYVPVDGADPVADGGRLASAACDTLAPGQADFYVAGPAPFVAAVTERLAELGMDTARLRCTRV